MQEKPSHQDLALFVLVDQNRTSVLTKVARGEALTPDDAQAAKELFDVGLITQDQDGYKVTPAGNQLIDKVEKDTLNWLTDDEPQQ